MTYQYALNPTSQQIETMTEWLNICRGVWNYALAERKDWYKSRSCRIDAASIKAEYIIAADAPRPNFALQCKALTEAKKTKPWLKSVQSQVLQQVLKQLENAFTSMWEQKCGFPRFKKLGRMRSFLFPQFEKNPILGNRIKLPVIGYVKIRLSRPIPDGFILKQVRIVRKASGWFAMLSLQCDVNVPDSMPHGHSLGIDLGLLSFLATWDSETIARPKFFIDTQRKLKLLQKRASSKIKGSNNWRKAQAKVARLHEHISNTRSYFHFKTAHHLCNQARMIFAEDLNLKAMSRGMLCKHTLDAGFGQFLDILKWVCSKKDVYFAKVDANGTSQTCPNCQTHTGKKELSQRIHECPNCQYITDRDVAAAQVVVQRGLVAVGHTVLMLSEGKVVGLPVKKESPSFNNLRVARIV
ncbi:MAG: transposase [Nostoc sp.]